MILNLRELLTVMVHFLAALISKEFIRSHAKLDGAFLFMSPKLLSG